MKKQYFQPQVKKCNLYGESLLDDVQTISVDVHTDDPQPPGGALGNESGVWEGDEEDADLYPLTRKTIWSN